jgi:DNA-binding NarL/FixJ family response regulator
MPVRVLVAEDFPLLREGFIAALNSHPSIQVVGEAGDGREAVLKTVALRPDVLTLDLFMPEMGGMMVLERLRHERLSTKILVLTASERPDSLLDSVATGASGYLTKRCNRIELCDAVMTVHAGGSVITPSLAGHLLREYSSSARGEPSKLRPLLAAREHEVLRLIARGRTDKEIALALSISPRTVQNYLGRIRQKTGLRRRSELTRWAVEHAVA